MAQDGLAAYSWLRWLCRLNDTVFIVRHDRRSVAKQVAQVRHAIRETGSLAIFPEGTTGWGLEIMPFKSSLLSAITPLPDGISIQPVWLDYGQHRGHAAWIGDEHGKDSYLKIAARPAHIELSAHFLPTLTGDALTDRKAIARSAREAIVCRKDKTEADKDQRVAL